MILAMRMPKLLDFCSHSEGTKAATWTCARGVCALKSSSLVHDMSYNVSKDRHARMHNLALF